MSSSSQNPILKKISILTLYLIYLFDIGSIVIVLVLFSSLIIDRSSTIIPIETSIHTRNVILGLLFAAYPLTQFFGAPILGELSDRIGRKLILNISTFGTGVSFFLSAWAILDHHLVVLFISRLMGGFFAGNASLAQATVSGLVDSKIRSKAMAFFSVAGGFAWIIGPFLGTFFSNSNVVSWFGLDTPFWLMGLIFFLCWGLILLSLENLKLDIEKEKTSVIQIYKNLIQIFNQKIIVAPFIASLISIAGWMVIQSFFSPFLMEKFQYNQNQVGFAFAYMSVWWLAGGLFATFTFGKLRPSKFIAWNLCIIVVLVVIYTIDPTDHFIYWASAIANVLYSIQYSAFMALFSHLVPDKLQGKLFGAWVGGYALMAAFAPAFGGWISFLGLGVPFKFGAGLMLIGAIMYILWHSKEKKALNKKHV